MNFLQKYGLLIVLIFVVLSSLITCGQSKKITTLTKQVDSLQQSQITEAKMREIIKSTPNWKTLEIEELSDKERIPINHYKNQEEK